MLKASQVYRCKFFRAIGRNSRYQACLCVYGSVLRYCSPFFRFSSCSVSWVKVAVCGDGIDEGWGISNALIKGYLLSSDNRNILSWRLHMQTGNPRGWGWNPCGDPWCNIKYISLVSDVEQDCLYQTHISSIKYVLYYQISLHLLTKTCVKKW